MVNDLYKTAKRINCETEIMKNVFRFSPNQRVIARRHDEAICYLTHDSVSPLLQFYLCAKTKHTLTF
jgi:hypothetical protein